MATAPLDNATEIPRAQTIGVLRLLVAGAVTAALLFILCWLGTYIASSSPTHAYISLFTAANVSSVEALVEGATWSLLFGGIAGAIFALVYNAAGRLEAR